MILKSLRKINDNIITIVIYLNTLPQQIYKMYKHKNVYFSYTIQMEKLKRLSIDNNTVLPEKNIV